MEIINLDYTFNTRDLCDIKTTDGLYIKKNRLIIRKTTGGMAYDFRRWKN